MEKYLKDFIRHDSMPGKVIVEYAHLVPNQIITLWNEYGCGTFF